uniref:THAP-type domain-containing protein n=1 Tax=Anopheles minimus TaxID=112268 RepID=A0A182WKC9_9DIPT
MRNCFVYKCDRQHKNAPKRTMFNVPKDPQKFEEWRQALPKHRPLAKHDRVCEKHFKSSDILRDWTYQIQGKTRKLLRTKPILQPDAIPSIFSAFEPDTAIVPNAKRRRKKSPEPSEEGNSVVVVVESTSQPLVEQPIDQEQSVVILINDESENASRQDATSGENKVAELFEIEMDIIEKESIFEELYDNIFEVELPSTLWGVHREPDRKFVAFSRFEWREQDVNAARSVSLLVDSSLGCRAWFGGKLVFSNDLTPKLVSRSDDKENPILSNMVIVELLDNLEQSATKEEWDAEEIKTKLETCVRS